MKQLFVYSVFIITFLITSCDESDPVVGSTQQQSISNLTFNVDTTYVDASNNRLVAKGTVKNSGNVQVTSPWYVECQFYTDVSRSTKLGGNYTQIGVPLNKNQSTFWTISYSSSNVNVTNYPNFAVGDLRGVYK